MSTYMNMALTIMMTDRRSAGSEPGCRGLIPCPPLCRRLEIHPGTCRRRYLVPMELPARAATSTAEPGTGPVNRRRPILIMSRKGVAPCGPGTKRRLVGPWVHKNLGALREVLYYDPDKEDRGGVSLTDFLESATAALTLGNLEGEDLMQIMPIRLQGAAKTFFRTYLESKGLHLKSPTLGRFWPHFETALKERFHKVTDSVTTLMKLANCREGEKETVRAYAQRVKAMANQLWPALLQSQNPTGLEAAKTLVYQHFQKGLRPHFLEYLNLKDVTDIETAISVLSKKESFDQTQKERFNGQVNMVSAEMPLRDGAISELNKQMSDLKTTVSAYMAETTALVRGQMDGAAKASHQEQPYDPQVYTEVPYPEYGEIPYHPTIPGSPFTEYGESSFYQTAPEVPHPTEGGDLYSHTGPDGRQAVPAEPEGDWNPLSDYENSGWVNAVGYQARLPQYPIIRPPMPAGQAQYGPRGGCHYCGGPHAWRQCPRLGYRPAYPAAGVPYQSRFPRPNAAMGYPARPPRPTGAFPPRAMWRTATPMRPWQPYNWSGPRPAPYQPAQAKPSLNGQHRL